MRRKIPVPTENLIGCTRLVFPGPAQHTPATRFPPDLGCPSIPRPYRWSHLSSDAGESVSFALDGDELVYRRGGKAVTVTRTP